MSMNGLLLQHIIHPMKNPWTFVSVGHVLKALYDAWPFGHVHVESCYFSSFELNKVTFSMIIHVHVVSKIHQCFKKLEVLMPAIVFQLAQALIELHVLCNIVFTIALNSIVLQ